MRVRVDVRMKSRAWPSDEGIHADDGTGQRPSRDEIRDGIPSGHGFRIELAIHVRVEHGIVADGGYVLRPLIEFLDGGLPQFIEPAHVAIHVEHRPPDVAKRVSDLLALRLVVGEIGDDAGGGLHVEVGNDALPRGGVRGKQIRHSARPCEADNGAPVQHRIDRDVRQRVEARA